MSETRRMHFVPRTYLKHFSQERNKDQFFIHAKAKDTGKIFEPNINRICLETDLYLLDGVTVEERQLLESMYYELFEDGYDTIYKILTDGNRETITMEERYEIISFVVSMFYRNNVWNAGFNKLMDETLEKVYYLTKQTDQDSFFFEEQEISITGRTLEELKKENRNKDRQMIAINGMQKIFELTRLRVINDVVTVIHTEQELVTSDNPIIVKAHDTKQRSLPIDPTNTLSIPIDAHHLLQLQPLGNELDRTMIGRLSEVSIMSMATAMANNQYQDAQTGRFLLGTETGIKNFQPDPTGELRIKRLQEKFFKKGL